jgi:hypothetical protein
VTSRLLEASTTRCGPAPSKRYVLESLFQSLVIVVKVGRRHLSRAFRRHHLQQFAFIFDLGKVVSHPLEARIAPAQLGGRLVQVS